MYSIEKFWIRDKHLIISEKILEKQINSSQNLLKTNSNFNYIKLNLAKSFNKNVLDQLFN